MKRIKDQEVIGDKQDEFKMNLQLFTGEKEDIEDPETPPIVEEEKEEKEGKEEKEERTFEEILAEERKKWESETDRRVNQALEKKQKEHEEKERIAKLSEDERIAEIERQREETLLERERELEVSYTRLDIVNELKEAEMLEFDAFFKPENYLRDNKERLKEDIALIREAINKRVLEETEIYKSEYLKGGQPPKDNPGPANKNDGVDLSSASSIIDSLFG